jgi:hypothetical protein
MPLFSAQSINRRRVVRLVGEIILLVALAGIIIWLSSHIQNVRGQLFSRNAQVDGELENISRFADLESEIELRSADVDRAKGYVLKKNEIGDVIALIEKEATARGLSLRIPLVQEQKKDEDKDKDDDSSKEESGPLRDVDVQVVVDGSPVQVLDFFYAVEHLPYLLSVNRWHIDAVADTITQGEISQLPSSAPVGAVRPASEQDGSAELTMNIVLTIYNDEAE